MRSNIVPKNVCFDTTSIITNLCDVNVGETLKKYKKKDMYFQLWNSIFKLNKRVFKKNNYKFSNMIRTDGISCCILFIRIDNKGEPLKKTIKNKSNKQEDNTKYIENTLITDEMKNEKIVAIDPNKADLIYCGSKNKNNKLETFRYTQNQRRLETRNKK